MLVLAEKAVLGGEKESESCDLAMKGCEYRRGKRAGWSKDNNRAPTERRKAVRLQQTWAGVVRIDVVRFTEENVLGRLRGGKRGPSTMQLFRGPRQHYVRLATMRRVRDPARIISRKEHGFRCFKSAD